MKTCGVCGGGVQKHHAFCTHCGNRIAISDSATAQPTQNPEAPQPNQPTPPGTMIMPSAATKQPQRPQVLVSITLPDGRPGSNVLLKEGASMAGSAGAILLDSDPHISPEHASFTLNQGELEVTNLPGTSGVWLSLAPGRSTRLAPGAKVRIGDQVLQIQRLPEPEESIPSVWGSRDKGAPVRLLQRLAGGGEGAAWLLHEGEWDIGREGCPISLADDGFLSARHGRFIVLADGSVDYEDLGSSNGSFVRLEETTRLTKGDSLLLGHHLIRVEKP